jgi:hypothetical protein
LEISVSEQIPLKNGEKHGLHQRIRVLGETYMGTAGFLKGSVSFPAGAGFVRRRIFSPES